MKPEVHDPVLSGGVIFAAIFTIAVHLLMGIGMMEQQLMKF